MIHVVSTQKEGEKDAAVLSKVHHGDKQKRRGDKHTHTQTTKIRSDQHIQISNFRFKSREKRTRGSEWCEKDRTAIKIAVWRGNHNRKTSFLRSAHSTLHYSVNTTSTTLTIADPLAWAPTVVSNGGNRLVSSEYIKLRKMRTCFPLLLLVLSDSTAEAPPGVSPVIMKVNGAIMEQFNNKPKIELAGKLENNEYIPFVKNLALEVMKSGFNAGDGYSEVWIRDYNTFIELATQVFPKDELKENLLVFCRMQGEDGNIIDGFTPAGGETHYSYSFNTHKNTVETDQESSLVQAVYKYIQFTGDESILFEKIGDKTVAERLEWAMDFLMQNRFNQQYGLIIGATTADWGDVQPEHVLGVNLDENTHMAIDIYDNAMFVIALNKLTEIIPTAKQKWNPIKESVAENCRKHLWDGEKQKFIPHIYLEKGSPFPADFNEKEIYYFGGTAIAIEAGLLSKDEVEISLNEMIKRVTDAGAASIGLTLYPPYPEGYFLNPSMSQLYSYQNGGDWTWFGGRMIQQLIAYGFVQEAYDQIQPMLKRVKDNNGFYEYYSVDNQPRGSGTFRGEAGVLYTAIVMFENWKKTQVQS
jgi:Glycosyl hydrolase 36 superfamily, catalytic domain